MRYPKVLSLALAAALLAAAPAHANRQQTTMLWAAMSAAERHWHAVPCGGQIAMGTAAALPGGARGFASWDPGPTNCRVTLQARYLRIASADPRATWPMFCYLITHEFGHLLGYGHSADPSDVMDPVFDLVNWSNTPSECWPMPRF